MKKLLTPLTLLALLSLSTPTLALRKFTLYLPNQDSCAIYQDRIYSEKTFTVWMESHRHLTIKANQDLQVAVISDGQLVIPYQVQSVPNTELFQQSYLTSMTGNHQIVVVGKNHQETMISFCLQ